MLKAEHLRCFVASIKEGSFAEASKTLNISATAVAYNVEALESRLKTTLLVRKQANGVSATRDGQRLFARADSILKELLEIEELFCFGRERSFRGELIVGCQEGLSWSLVPRAIERLNARHPNLSVVQKTVFMDEGNAPILSGAVDVLITFVVNPPPDSGVDTEILCEPSSYAMMRAGHPLSENRSHVNLEELVQYPHVFILDGPAWDLFTGMYRDKGLTPKLDKVSNISTSAQAIVGRSDSVSLRVVKPAHDRSPLGDQLAFMPIADATRHATVVAAWAKSKHSGAPAKVEGLVAECRELFANGVMREHLFYDALTAVAMPGPNG